MDVVAQAEAADRLASAYETRVPIEPLTEKYTGLMLGDAYEIQLLQIRRRIASGARVKGHKVGLTSAALALAANDLGRRGLAIEPGWIVLTGGMTDAVFVTPGSALAVHFTHLGSIFLSGG